MRDSSKRIPYGWVVALIAVLLIGALPAVWASPLAVPLRQTVPGPDPTPTPRPLECKLLAPCELVTVTETIENEGTLPMEGCIIRLEEVDGIEYLVDGVVLTAPYTIAVPRLLPGEKADIKFDIRLKCDDPAVVPCMMYVIDV
ncbi:MAG: hypothetical protein R6X16_14665, partial [Anaerolineae bacterium]